MDAFKHSEILAMLEGGNKQLGDFFDRHHLSSSLDTNLINTESLNNIIHNGNNNRYDTPVSNRYKTNAAKFYKKNLSLHAQKVKDFGIYQGREIFRKSSSPLSSKQQQKQQQQDNYNNDKIRYDVKVEGKGENKSCSKNECVESLEAKAYIYND